MKIRYKKISYLAIILPILSIISCCADNKDNNTFRKSSSLLKYDQEIDSIISLMTLEEKVNLLHGTGKFISGGIERLGIPELHYTDGPLGIREELERDSWKPAGWTNDSATFFPSGSAMGSTWNPELLMKCGQAIGEEARARKKDILLVPAINILRSPLNGRNYEYLTEDPFLNKTLAVAYIKGVQSRDVAACVKHYAVNNQETNRGSISVELSERALREIYLPGFKASVQEGSVYTVMGAYNKLRGEYLCENSYMLHDILKGEWGFNGAVVSDWGAVHNTKLAAKAGLDIEMGTDTNSYSNYYFAQPLVDAVQDGQIDEDLINDKVRRVLRVIKKLKINNPGREEGSINTKEHSDIVYKVASESIVLLKNDSNILPIKKETKRIAVMGDNATRTFGAGGFGAGVKSRYEVTPLEGLINRIGGKIDISYSKGYVEKYIPGKNDDLTYGRIIDYSIDQNLIDEAVMAAKNADYALIFAGSNRHTETESIDREDMRLPFAQEALIEAVAKVNKNTILVFTIGTPYDIESLVKKVPGVIISWFSGSEAGNALADVLVGNVNPSGKLPFTFPKKLEDSPAHAMNAFPGNKDSVEYKEDLLVGYRWYDTKGIDPLYCFGYGMSYTKFDIKNININQNKFTESDTLFINADISNVGQYDGAEVIQIYAQKLNSKVSRPAKELKGYKKTFVGREKYSSVLITIPVDELAYFNESEMRWMVEKGEYLIDVSTSSRKVIDKFLITIQ